MRLNNKWFSGLSEKEKKELKEAIENSQRVLNRLREILEKEEATLIKQTYKLDNYDKANWTEYMSDRLGSIRTLNEVIDLIPQEK